MKTIFLYIVWCMKKCSKAYLLNDIFFLQFSFSLNSSYFVFKEAGQVWLSLRSSDNLASGKCTHRLKMCCFPGIFL